MRLARLLRRRQNRDRRNSGTALDRDRVGNSGNSVRRKVHRFPYKGTYDRGSDT